MEFCVKTPSFERKLRLLNGEFFDKHVDPYRLLNIGKHWKIIGKSAVKEIDTMANLEKSTIEKVKI